MYLPLEDPTHHPHRTHSKWKKWIFELPQWIGFYSTVTICFTISVVSLCVAISQTPVGSIFFVAYDNFVHYQFQSHQMILTYASIPVHTIPSRRNVALTCPYDGGSGMDKFWFLATIPSNITCPNLSDFKVLSRLPYYYSLALLFGVLSICLNAFRLTTLGRNFELTNQYRSLLISVVIYGPTIVFSVTSYVILGSFLKIIEEDPQILKLPTIYFDLPSYYYPKEPQKAYFYYSIPAYNIIIYPIIFNCIGIFLGLLGNFLSFNHFGREVRAGEPRSCACWQVSSYLVKSKSLTINGIILVLGYCGIFVLAVLSFLTISTNRNMLNINVDSLSILNGESQGLTYSFYTNYMMASDDHLIEKRCDFVETTEYHFPLLNGSTITCPPTHRFVETSVMMTAIYYCILILGVINVLWHVLRVCDKTIMFSYQFHSIFVTNFLTISFIALCFVASTLNFEKVAYEVLYPSLDCSMGCSIRDGFRSNALTTTFFWRLTAYLTLPLLVLSNILSCCFPWCRRPPSTSQRYSSWVNPTASRNIEKIFGKHVLEVYFSALPREITESFSHFLIGDEEWKPSDLCYYAKLKKGTWQWKVMETLYLRLGGESLPPEHATALCNPSLISNFVNQKNILQFRFKNDLHTFNNKMWRKRKDKERRNWVYSKYQELVHTFNWNSNLPIPILPVVHGTNLPIANQIANTGFAKLSLLDEGFYGRGIYFTNSILYASPYFAMQEEPAMILGYLLTGNAFPVYEDPFGDNSIRGSSLKTNSHVVLTDQSGLPLPPSDEEEPYFFEIVIEQESLILPLYIIQPNVVKYKHILDEYQRKIVPDSTLPQEDTLPNNFTLEDPKLSYEEDTETDTFFYKLKESITTSEPSSAPPLFPFSTTIEKLVLLPVWIPYHVAITACYAVSFALCVYIIIKQPLSFFWSVSDSWFVSLTFGNDLLKISMAQIPFRDSVNHQYLSIMCNYDYGNGLDPFWFLDGISIAVVDCPNLRDLKQLQLTVALFGSLITCVFFSIIWSAFKITPTGRSFKLKYQIQSLLISLIIYSPTIALSILLFLNFEKLDTFISSHTNNLQSKNYEFYPYPASQYNVPNNFVVKPYSKNYYYYSVPGKDTMLYIGIFNCIGLLLELIGTIVSVLHCGRQVGNGEPGSCSCWLFCSKFTKTRKLTIFGFLLAIGFGIVFGLLVFTIAMSKIITLNTITIEYFDFDHLTRSNYIYKFYSTYLKVDHNAVNGAYTDSLICPYKSDSLYSINYTTLTCPPTDRLKDMTMAMDILHYVILLFGGLNLLWHIIRMTKKHNIILHHQFKSSFVTSALSIPFIALCFYSSTLNLQDCAFETIYPTMNCFVPPTCTLTMTLENQSQFYWVLTGSLAIPLYLFSSGMNCCFPWCMRAPSSSSRQIEKIFGKQLLQVYLLSLPREITESFSRFSEQEEWKQQTDLCYFSQLERGTLEWSVMETMYHSLGGAKLPPLSATVLCNPSLISNFVNQNNILQTRFGGAPAIFNNKNWKKKADKDRRSWVYSKYEGYVNQFVWNKDLIIPIIPVVHGTYLRMANQIANTGFAKLSQLDEGFYGRGIYFTNSILYASPYFSMQEEPAMLLGYLLTGNSFPVYEDPFGDNSIRGSSLKTNSNIIVTDITGLPTQDDSKPFFLEFVIEQESLVLPMYIIQPDLEAQESVIEEYKRQIIQHTPAPSTNNSERSFFNLKI